MIRPTILNDKQPLIMLTERTGLFLPIDLEAPRIGACRIFQ